MHIPSSYKLREYFGIVYFAQFVCNGFPHFCIVSHFSKIELSGKRKFNQEVFPPALHSSHYTLEIYKIKFIYVYIRYIHICGGDE